MIVKAQLEFKDFLKINYLLLYRRPMMLWLTFVGGVMLILSIRDLMEVARPNTNPVYFFVFGLFIVVIVPFSVFLSARKHFRSNARVHEVIEYEFDLKQMKVRGESFQSEIEWRKTYKVWEIREWFLIYQNNLVFNILPKRFFTGGQLSELRSLLRQAEIKNLKLKK